MAELVKETGHGLATCRSPSRSPSQAHQLICLAAARMSVVNCKSCVSHDLFRLNPC